MNKLYRTGDQTWVRERNLAIVLNYIWDASGPISRAYLTQISGLNKSTVGSLLTQLQAWGLVEETGMANQRPGRPGVLIDIAPDAGRIVGVEIAVGMITVVLADIKANVTWRRSVDKTPKGLPLTEVSQADVLKLTEQLVREAIAESAASDRRLFGIGVSVPGLVDHHSGAVLYTPNLGWHNLPLHSRWKERFHVPIVVENDANASALGEQMLGVAKQVNNFVYISSGVGLGGGLVIDGKVYGGVGGFAGEIGHMTLEPDGPQCNCGNRGCWETLVGPRAILQRARQAAGEGRAPILLALSHGRLEDIQLDQVMVAASQGEPAVLSALDEVGRYLGIGIANLINALNPRMVVLGGVLSVVGPYLLPRAEQEVRARAMQTSRDRVQITLSKFQLDACVMGGVALILRGILNNPAAWFKSATVPFEDRSLMTTGAL
ncbi:MAG: ROK family protein [Anaerolineae bacterium]